MEIKLDRTIALIIFNGKVGLVTEKYKNNWTVDCDAGDWTAEEKDLVPLFQLRKKADLGRITSDEIIERHRVAIMNALIRKVVSLANEKDRLIEKLSKLNSKLGSGDQGED